MTQVPWPNCKLWWHLDPGQVLYNDDTGTLARPYTMVTPTPRLDCILWWHWYPGQTLHYGDWYPGWTIHYGDTGTCQNRFLRWTPTQVEISAKGCQWQVEEMRRSWGLWLQCMCCTLAIPASSYFGGLKDRETEVQQRSELPEGRGDRGEQRGVCRKYSRWYLNWGTIPSACGEVAKSLWMTNGWVTYMERRSVISVTDQKVNRTQLWVIRSNLKQEQGKQEQKRNRSIQ